MGLGIENFSFPINPCIRKKPKSVVMSVYHYTYFFLAKFVDLGCQRKSCDVPHQISFLPLFPVVILSFSLSLRVSPSYLFVKFPSLIEFSNLMSWFPCIIYSATEFTLALTVKIPLAILTFLCGKLEKEMKRESRRKRSHLFISYYKPSFYIMK